MKKLTILFITVAFLFACNNEPEDFRDLPVSKGCDTTGLAAAYDSCKKANHGDASKCWTDENLSKWCETHHH